MTSLDTSITLITPTAGRASLERTLRSYLPQMADNDEYLIMGDTLDSDLELTQEIVAKFDERFRYIPVKHEQHTFGHSEINDGIDLARNAWLVMNDDDDIGTPDALYVIRAVIEQIPEPTPLLFRYRTYHGPILWHDLGCMTEGCIGGHCIVTPNLPGLVGRYSERYAGDHDYIMDTLNRWPNGINSSLWIDRMIAIARPQL